MKIHHAIDVRNPDFETDAHSPALQRKADWLTSAVTPLGMKAFDRVDIETRRKRSIEPRLEAGLDITVTTSRSFYLSPEQLAGENAQAFAPVIDYLRRLDTLA